MQSLARFRCLWSHEPSAFQTSAVARLAPQFGVCFGLKSSRASLFTGRLGVEMEEALIGLMESRMRVRMILEPWFRLGKTTGSRPLGWKFSHEGKNFRHKIIDSEKHLIPLVNNACFGAMKFLKKFLRSFGLRYSFDVLTTATRNSG